jgi:hypothetical protein
MTGWYDDVYKLIADKETLPGQTDPKTLATYSFLVQQALGDPEKDPEVLAGLIAADSGLARAQKITMITTLAGLNNNEALMEWDPYKLAKYFLQRQSPVPLDSTDTSASAIRGRAIHNLWSQDIAKLLKENDPVKFKKFDFFGRAQELVNNHADLWGKPSETGAQIILQDTVKQSGLGEEPGVTVGGGGDSRLVFPDVTAIQAALQRNAPNMNKEQIRKAVDAIRTLNTYPGLSEKVSELKKAAKLAAQPKGPEPLTGMESFMRTLTPDDWEKWGKEKFPEKFKKIYGEDQTVTPEPIPEPTPEPIPEPTPEPITGVRNLEKDGIDTEVADRYEIWKVQNKQNTIDKYNAIRESDLLGEARNQLKKQLDEQYPTGTDLMDLLKNKKE